MDDGWLKCRWCDLTVPPIWRYKNGKEIDGADYLRKHGVEAHYDQMREIRSGRARERNMRGREPNF